MRSSTRGVCVLVVAIGSTAAPASALDLKPPVADKRPHLTVTHGDTLRDDYFWLREKTSPDVIRYLEAENAYVDAVMEPTKALQETLYNEMLGRIKETDEDVPYREGGYYTDRDDGGYDDRYGDRYDDRYEDRYADRYRSDDPWRTYDGYDRHITTTERHAHQGARHQRLGRQIVQRLAQSAVLGRLHGDANTIGHFYRSRQLQRKPRAAFQEPAVSP